MNIDTLRTDTPATQNIIHLNNAGASLMPVPVVQAVKNYLDAEAALGGYEVAAREQENLDEFYTIAARLVNAKPTEIAFAHSATDAWTRLFFSLPWNKGDVILTGQAEYASNYIAFLQVKERHGVEVQVVPDAPEGGISVNALGQAIHDRVKLIALTHMPTNGGLVNPAEAVGTIAKKHQVYYLLDACQSAGQYPLDVQAIGCDMLTATGRKYLRGPRGTGFLFVAERLQKQVEPFMLDLFSAEWTGPDAYEQRNDARAFEFFEHNFAGKIGLAKAMEYALDLGLDAIWERVQSLAAYLRQQARQLPQVKVRDIGALQSGIVSLELPGQDIGSLMLQLRTRGINTSIIVPSGTLLDMQERQLAQMLRVSVHYYNTEKEIDRLFTVLVETIS